MVVAPRYIGLASDVFAGLGITIVSGHPFLGGLIGEPEHCEELLRRKVTDWVHSVHALASVAKKSPPGCFCCSCEISSVRVVLCIACG